MDDKNLLKQAKRQRKNKDFLNILDLWWDNKQKKDTLKTHVIVFLLLEALEIKGL